MLIVSLYVDDLIFTSDFGIKDFRTIMESKFEMTDLGLMKFFYGNYLYFKNFKFFEKFGVLTLYVDDLIFTGDFGIADFKEFMESEFEITDLGLMKFFSGN